MVLPLFPLALFATGKQVLPLDFMIRASESVMMILGKQSAILS